MKQVLLKLLSILVLLALQAFTPIKSQLGCDEIHVFHWAHYERLMNTCKMQRVAIGSPGALFTTDEDLSITAIFFDENGKVVFLPDNVHEKFPLLLSYSAWRCGIKAINKRNFQKLHKLEYLSLGVNFIERIETNTFEDLTALKSLHLHDNQIKVLSARTFARTKNLELVWLKKNICIDQDFNSRSSISSIEDAISIHCEEPEPELSLNEGEVTKALKLLVFLSFIASSARVFL